MPEEMEKAIREMLRDAEVIDLLKNFPVRARSGATTAKAAYGAWLRVTA